MVGAAAAGIDQMQAHAVGQAAGVDACQGRTRTITDHEDVAGTAEQAHRLGDGAGEVAVAVAGLGIGEQGFGWSGTSFRSRRGTQDGRTSDQGDERTRRQRLAQPGGGGTAAREGGRTIVDLAHRARGVEDDGGRAGSGAETREQRSGGGEAGEGQGEGAQQQDEAFAQAVDPRQPAGGASEQSGGGEGERSGALAGQPMDQHRRSGERGQSGGGGEQQGDHRRALRAASQRPMVAAAGSSVTARRWSVCEAAQARAQASTWAAMAAS